jgi:serine/threonine protein kinase
VKLYTHFDDDYHVFLLMEYVEGGILLNKLKCTEEYASHILEQTIDAVSDLHSRQIAHRDIKPENIVLQFDVPVLASVGCGENL